ncbi:MAG: glycosyltransferase family 4 protein, partial [Candidatus Lokiarchaeota archaeon]|nr:glycosyltransferase family 4 protein [Candidatus Lokiarchaeota archaeon]
MNVVECNISPNLIFQPSFSLFKEIIHSYLKLIKKISRITYDYLFFPYPAFKYIPLSLIYSLKTPIIYDPFVSLYNTFVYDHKSIKINSVKSKFVYSYEKFFMKIPNIILTDTKTHGLYYKKFFNLRHLKFNTIYLGSDNTVFYPLKYEKPKHKFIVGFIGNYIPAQGIKYIFDSAKILEDFKEIQFEIVGGQPGNNYYRKMLEYFKFKKLRNVKLIPRNLQESVRLHISRSDILLGIFGNSIKTNLAIPNKVFEAIQMKVPIITSNTPAIKELFTHMENIYLCQKSNHNSLANAILDLVNDQNLRNK